MVNEVEEDNNGCSDGNIQCVDHPYKNNTPGGICAFCLQEKLGKLVSSSFPIAVFPSSSSSPSPSFRSTVNSSSSASNTLPLRNTVPYPSNSTQKRSRLGFLVTQKKKKDLVINPGGSSVLKRSKSIATPRRELQSYGALKRGFWPFLYTNKQHSHSNRCREKKREEFITVVEENEEKDESPNHRKVSRSRSVGCGSRSFSGDFFDRISTGFGDCTLRRVESQREGKSKARSERIIKDRVKCGGLFSGFMITSSSSSSSSSSNYISSTDDKSTQPPPPAPPAAAAVTVTHNRNKSWGWALASPIRAFRPSSNKKKAFPIKKTTPDLTAVPSLLAVRN